MIVYIYDLKFETKQKFNRLKRKFYYNLEKLGLNKDNFPTKSTIVVEDKKEEMMDMFFKEFRKTEGTLEVYKFFTTYIEEL